MDGERIPDAVTAAAIRALMVPEHEMVESVSRAILAERERCARIADAHAECECDCGDVIAAAIRTVPCPT